MTNGGNRCSRHAILLNLIKGFLALFVVAVTTTGLASSVLLADDPIPGYLTQIDSSNLAAVATDLVTLYGPRREDAYSPYINANCTVGSTVYPKSTIDMAGDYIKGRFEAMGYPSSAITMEQLPGNAGYNVYVTKVGATYPNVYLEFSGHYDSAPGTPGGADNASGSSAVIELARVLKDYPNRYSMRFILWAAEEYSVQRGVAYYGSAYHVQQALNRGEQIKAGLVMDHIGWPYPSDPTGYMNEVSHNGAESERIADMFNQVRSDYDIAIGFGKDWAIQNSDEHSYWDAGLTAVSSGGGWLYYRPNYHLCGDTVSNINFANVLRTAQQNLAVGLLLDAESYPPPNQTSVPTSTPAPPTATGTPPGIPTNTPGAPLNFPSTGMLDDFNRTDGALGSNWSESITGYNVDNHQLSVGAGEDVYWTASNFGADQEVFVTLDNIGAAAAEIGLILKSQSNSSFGSGLIDVLYDPTGKRVQVWTYLGSQGWVQRRTDLAVVLSNGDQFGARARTDGQVEIYQNDVLLGTRNVTGWPFYASSGHIGLFMLDAEAMLLDDFGGGTTGEIVAPTPTATNTASSTPVPPTATNTPVVVPTNTATNTPVVLPTNTATNTPVVLPTNTATNTPVVLPTNTATNTPLPPTATNTPLPPTATNTPVVVPTNTATNTPLPPTATNTPIATPMATGFPRTGVLDNFNRADGALDANWAGNTAAYEVTGDKLAVEGGEDVYWRSTSFGVDQEVYVTLSNIEGTSAEIGLILKSQSDTGYSPGLIDVLYDPVRQQVQVWTYSVSNSRGWSRSGTNLPATFVNGDQFGARVKADAATVEIYRNGQLIGSRPVAGWPYLANSGYIGLFNVDAAGTVLDNFGGGTISTP